MLPIQNQNTMFQQSGLADIEDIHHLLADAQRLRTQDSQMSISLAQQALAQIQTLPDSQRLPLAVEGYLALASSFKAAHVFQQALTAVLQAQAALEQYPDPAYTIQIHMMLSSLHIVQGDFTDGFAALTMAQQVAQQSGDQAAQADILSNMGQTYLWIDEYPQGIRHLQQALLLGDQGFLPDHVLAMVLNNLAYAYLVVDQMQDAHHAAQRGLALSQHAQDIASQLILLGTLSEIALAEHDHAAAEAALQESQRISDQAESPRFRFEHLRSMTTFLIKTGQIECAIMTSKEALALVQPMDAKLMMLEQFGNLVSLYEQKDDARQALQYAKAMKELRHTIQRERSDHRRAMQLEGYRYEYLRQEQQRLQEKNVLLEHLAQEREHALRVRQQLNESIAAISMPILPLFSGVLTVPLVGVLDDQRVVRLYEEFLQAIGHYQAQIALLDMTGIAVVDSFVASSLIHLVEGAKLMGCRVILVGVRPDIAQSFVGLGVSLAHILTFASFADGLRAALQYTGYRLRTMHARP